MPSELPRLFLARHGDTAWTDSRQHTGRTDLPLNEAGEERARQIGERLRRFSFARVFTSPLQRASRTCELAGFGAVATVDPDLVEWDYGRFEGMLTRDILKERPGWELFRDGCPEGESPGDVAARADGFIARVRRHRGGRAGVLERAHHPDDRGPLARPAAGRRAVLLLPPRQRGRARLRAQEPRRADHRPLESRRPTAGVSRADRGRSSRPQAGASERTRSS